MEQLDKKCTLHDRGGVGGGGYLITNHEERKFPFTVSR